MNHNLSSLNLQACTVYFGIIWLTIRRQFCLLFCGLKIFFIDDKIMEKDIYNNFEIFLTVIEKFLDATLNDEENIYDE